MWTPRLGNSFCQPSEHDEKCIGWDKMSQINHAWRNLPQALITLHRESSLQILDFKKIGISLLFTKVIGVDKLSIGIP